MDRITHVRIKNVRAIQCVDLELSRPLTVLIGENGSGKSTIIECLELLRKASDPRFMEQFYAVHRGMPGLLRKGASDLSLGVRIEDDEGHQDPIDYAFTLRTQGAGASVVHEQLLVGPAGAGGRRLTAIQRGMSDAKVYDAEQRKLEDLPAKDVASDKLLISAFGTRAPHGAIDRVLAVLDRIEVHLGFDTLAAWAARSHQRPVSVRGSSTLFPADRLSLLGVNLASAWSALIGRDSAHFQRTMALVRLGLGERVDTVVVPPDAGGGNVYLALRFTDLSEPVLASDLSDGQLAWLAFVAMVRLNDWRSLLAVDEPELHLHPQLLGGVINLLASAGAPVIIATHSDRVLELLDKPAEAVRVCELDEVGRATLARVDPDELEKWLARYGDFGRIRAAGYLSHVLRSAGEHAEEAG